MNNSVYLTLGVYFILMLAIGIYGYFKTNNDVAGFMLGGRRLSPTVTALSAGASDMSGWMLMGLPGLIYLGGLSGSWIVIGLIIGAYLNYSLVAPRLRVYTEYLDDAVTIPEYLERRFSDNSHLIRILCATVIIIFFAIYTTSGVVAGGKLFESSFGISYEVGLYVTAGVVVAYSSFGGFMAVSTTDFVQGVIMLVALVLVPIVAFVDIGSWDLVESALTSISPTMLDLGKVSGLAIVSAMSWGLGYFGQPHIIVRFMAINNVKDLSTARRIGMSWMVISALGAIVIGLIGAAYVKINGLSLADPETIFILFSNILFHPIITGFLMAAILAAIMSTISSQLLVASSSITEDIYHTLLRKEATESERLLIARLSVMAVALMALGLAHDRNNSILSLVSNAWAGFGAAFGPVILISLYWSRMTKQGALAGMSVGAGTVLVWLYSPLTITGQSPSSVLYEIVPGFMFAFVATIIVSLITKPQAELDERHKAMQIELRRRLHN